VFERYLTVWVALCLLASMALRQVFPSMLQAIGRLELAQVNLPVGLLIWVMIIPMLMKIDFGALHPVRSHWKGIGVTLFVNWAVKPLVIAILAVPILIQVFFNAGLPYGLDRLVGEKHSVAGPSALTRWRRSRRWSRS
jgi:arsenite transporter